MTSASFGASGGKTGEMTGKSTRRDILYVVTHSIFFHYIEKIFLFDITPVSRREQKSISSQCTKKINLKLKNLFF